MLVSHLKLGHAMDQARTYNSESAWCFKDNNRCSASTVNEVNLLLAYFVDLLSGIKILSEFV